MMMEIKETVLEDGIVVKREIPTEYRCVKCSGVINKVEYYRCKIKMFHRWTCGSCQSRLWLRYRRTVKVQASLTKPFFSLFIYKQIVIGLTAYL
jgi:predicted metal-binding protein